MKKLSHYDSAGSPRMVDVSAKPETRRTARAHAFVRIAPATLQQLPRNPKGNASRSRASPASPPPSALPS